MSALGSGLGQIRHELRSPINQIIGYCELMLEDELPAGFKPDLERIRAGGQQLLVVIGDYFDDTRAAEGVRDSHRLNHDLRTPVNHIIGYSEMLEEQCGASGGAQLVEDLRRIRTAARTWLALMERHLLPESADAAGATVFAGVPAGGRHAASSGNKGRVLVVDDDYANRDLLGRRLERHGYAAGYAGDGLEALRRLGSEPFDLVLLDLLMPGLDGYQVLIRLKADPALRHLPVLMISGLDQEEGIARCIEAGADDYLTKPFNPVILQARLTSCFEKKRLRDQEQATYRALVESQERLAGELAEAGGYARSLLPPPLSAGPILADWCYQPSTQLGGDSFGYHWIDDDHFAVYLLDVCGHGVGAALLSVSVLNALRSGPLLAGNPGDPVAVFGALNRMFPMESQNQQYFTCWLGIYDRGTRRLVYASAGHPPSALISGGQEMSLLRTSGPPIGAFPDATYKAATVAVPDGSQLFVLSDGVYEIALPDGRTGSMNDFMASLASASAKAGFHPDQCLAMARAAGGQTTLDDDFSLVRLRFVA